jgi:hypothetical protein
MIRRNTWITLAVFIVLLGAAIWWTRSGQGQASSTEPTPTQAALWEVEADQIVEIRVDYLSTGDTVDLERQDDGAWVVLQPAEGSVTEARVQQALDWLAAPRPRTTIPDPADLLDFGLTEPVSRVTIRLAGGDERVFEVGAEAPTGTTQYVRLPGEAGVLAVSKYSLDGVLGLLEDVLPTPTATQTATETGAPAPDATSVPPGTPEP